MSDKNLARRADAEVSFGGVDITRSLRKYLLSIAYTDNEADEADDLQIRIADRDDTWLTEWLSEAGEATGLSVHAIITRENWNSDGKDKILDCGNFEIDSLDADGPPSTITIRATSLPYSAQIRQTKKSRAWESYSLSGIANEIATSNGMSCMYESANNPTYKRREQIKMSDIKFLSGLCRDAGISLKATGDALVLFDQAGYEAKGAVLTIKRNSKAYIKYRLSSGEADTLYASCRVSYAGSAGKIEGTAYAEDYNAKDKNNQRLEVTAKVSSIAEAKELAAKKLRLHNKHEKTADFTLPGNPDIVAGVTVTLEGWGMWSGKYMVSQSRHSVSGSGYTTQIKIRHVLEGY
jgi:phage protein D